jgi:hypothetical protein
VIEMLVSSRIGLHQGQSFPCHSALLGIKSCCDRNRNPRNQLGKESSRSHMAGGGQFIQSKFVADVRGQDSHRRVDDRAASICDSIHALKIPNHGGGIDKPCWSNRRQQFSSCSFDRIGITRDHCVGKRNQLTCVLYRTLVGFGWIGYQCDVVAISLIHAARTEQQRMGRRSVKAFVDQRYPCRNQFNLISRDRSSTRRLKVLDIAVA